MSWRKTAVVVGVLAVWPTVWTHLFLWQVEHRLDLKIHRKPVFVLVPGAFDLKQTSLEWKDRLHVKAGTLSVEFPPTALLRSYFPVVIHGKNLSVAFGSEWAASVGQEDVLFDFVNMELVVGGKRGFDIRSLDAESKTIRFSLKGE